MRYRSFLFLFSIAVAASVVPVRADNGLKQEKVQEFVVGKDPVGQYLIDFDGVTVDGEKVSSEDMRGKVLLIDLWGVNCGSCLDEMKVLEPIYQEFKEQGLEIWAVNSEQLDSEEIHQGLKQKGLSVSYPLLVDKDLSITRIFTSWFIPVTVIVDRNGTVQYYKIGFSSSDEKKIRRVIGELLQ